MNYGELTLNDIVDLFELLKIFKEFVVTNHELIFYDIESSCIFKSAIMIFLHLDKYKA